MIVSGVTGCGKWKTCICCCWVKSYCWDKLFALSLLSVWLMIDDGNLASFQLFIYLFIYFKLHGYILFLCASELHSCPKTFRNTSVSHTERHVPSLPWTHTLWFILAHSYLHAHTHTHTLLLPRLFKRAQRQWTNGLWIQSPTNVVFCYFVLFE